MTMHLLPAYFTTTTFRRDKKRNPKRAAANAQHKAWIAEITKGKVSDKKLLTKKWRNEYSETIKVDRNYTTSNSFGTSDACVDRSIMNRLHKETKETRDEILRKASRCMPLYNKGGLQYATEGEDMTQVGTKSRRA